MFFLAPYRRLPEVLDLRLDILEFGITVREVSCVSLPLAVFFVLIVPVKFSLDIGWLLEKKKKKRFGVTFRLHAPQNHFPSNSIRE